MRPNHRLAALLDVTNLEDDCGRHLPVGADGDRLYLSTCTNEVLASELAGDGSLQPGWRRIPIRLALGESIAGRSRLAVISGGRYLLVTGESTSDFEASLQVVDLTEDREPAHVPAPVHGLGKSVVVP